MKHNLAKHTARRILLQNKLYSLTDYNDLRRIVESNQFTIIEYKKHSHSEYVSELIKKLGVTNEIEHNDSFLYINKNLKFLFINSDVSNQDKCSLLRHELGHIYDSNLRHNEAFYSKIKKEEFASEFSCYSKNPDVIIKFCVFMIKKWKIAVGIIVLLAFVLGFFRVTNSLIIQPTKSVTSDTLSYEKSNSTYYVTSSGKKYHRKFCVIIKNKTNLKKCTLEEAVNGGYKPCLICIGEK